MCSIGIALHLGYLYFYINNFNKRGILSMYSYDIFGSYKKILVEFNYLYFQMNLIKEGSEYIFAEKNLNSYTFREVSS